MSEHDELETPGGTADAGRPVRGRTLRRIALGIGLALIALLGIAFVLYSFGGMQRPAEEYRVAYDALVAQGQVAPVDVEFTIPIPGCRCHSTDPVQQVHHSQYRLKDCSICH